MREQGGKGSLPVNMSMSLCHLPSPSFCLAHLPVRISVYPLAPLCSTCISFTDENAVSCPLKCFFSALFIGQTCFVSLRCVSCSRTPCAFP